MAETEWQTRAAEKRSRCDAAIPPEWRLQSSLLGLLESPLETNKNNLLKLDITRRSGILTARELDITECYDVSSLLYELSKGNLSALEVTVAFSKRAAVAQQLTGCLTEIFFSQAQDRARALDALKKDGKSAGPLHGLPISIKDGFQVVGIEATIGLVSNLGQVSQANSALVEVLLGLGAVLYVKTNIPQTLMTADSHNNVFGRTLNPWNTMLTAGGSSGGEGALVGFHGSPLGVGTDVGGSIRIPALCCGTYGFKPTATRVPYGGQRGCANPGIRAISPSAGPLANDIDALELFMKFTIDARPALLDSSTIDIPWRNVKDSIQPKLRLGILSEDPYFPLHPPVKEALEMAKRLLIAQGHEVVQLSAEDGHICDAMEVAWKLWDLDDTADRIVKAGGEPAVPSRKQLRQEAQNMNWHFVPEFTTGDRLDRAAALNIKRAEVVALWQKNWTNYRVDAIVAPSAQNTAVEHDTFGLPPYTTFLNLLDYPACVLPFGHVQQTTSQSVFELSEGQSGPPYNPEVLEGAPLSIQVFTSRMRDEECLVIAKMVDQVLHAESPV